MTQEKLLSLEERRTKYSVPALEKALDVLEYLADQAVPLTQAQLARALKRQRARSSACWLAWKAAAICGASRRPGRTLSL